MDRTIWKFPFDTSDFVYINMPIVAEILTVQVQNGQPCIWAVVDPTAKMRPVPFCIVGTGHPIPILGSMKQVRAGYVGTYQEGGGALIWHMFKTGGPV